METFFVIAKNTAIFERLGFNEMMSIAQVLNAEKPWRNPQNVDINVGNSNTFVIVKINSQTDDIQSSLHNRNKIQRMRHATLGKIT